MLQEEAIDGIGEIARHLLHEGLVRLVDDACDLDASRSQVYDEEHMEPLRKQLDLAFVAIQQLADVLNAARRHCRDTDRPE